MSQLVATVHVFDSHDRVAWKVVVRSYGGRRGATRTVLERQGFPRGRGDTDPAQWLARALRDALESLEP